ncbi:hypothetical protein [Streptomyces sp. NPDC005568]|uniref:hypothetical protein n=1 Tax=Streptomyces sp. NPDC005568 TaxID=3156887 RepID=UPI0033A5F973
MGPNVHTTGQWPVVMYAAAAASTTAKTASGALPRNAVGRCARATSAYAGPSSAGQPWRTDSPPSRTATVTMATAISVSTANGRDGRMRIAAA